MDSILTKPPDNVKLGVMKTGRKMTFIRWTLTNASKEFGVNQEIIAKRLKGQGIMPGEDGYWSTKQIATAVYGDLQRERIGLTCAERIAQEMKNAEAEGRLIDVEEFKKDYAQVYVEMVRHVRNSKLSDKEQDELLLAMAKLHQ